MAYECSKCHRMQYTNICIVVGSDKICRRCSFEYFTKAGTDRRTEIVKNMELVTLAETVRQGAEGYDA